MSEPSLKNLEKRLATLEEKMNSKSVKEKKPRKPSAYNKFVEEYINKEKKKKDNTRSHTELFSEAAKAWTAQKEK